MPPHMGKADTARADVEPETVTLDSRIRLASRRAARLAVEAGVAALYFSAHNDKVLHGHGDQPHRTDFDLDTAPALEHVITAYPKYVTVARLPAETDGQKLDIAKALVEARVVLVRPATAGLEMV